MPLSPAQSGRLKTYIFSPSSESSSRTLTRLLPSTPLPSPELRARAHQAILLHLAAYDDNAPEVPLDTLAGVVLDTWQACQDLDFGSDGDGDVDGGGEEEGKPEEFAMASGASVANSKKMGKGKAKKEQGVDLAGVKDMDTSQSLPLQVRHGGPSQHMPTTRTTKTTAIEGEHGMGEASAKLPQHPDKLTASHPRRGGSGSQQISLSGGRLTRFINACVRWIWSWNFILSPLIILIGPKFWIPFFLPVLPLCPHLLPVINSLASLIWNYGGNIMTLFGALAMLGGPMLSSQAWVLGLAPD